VGFQAMTDTRADRRQARKEAVIQSIQQNRSFDPSFRDVADWCHLPLSTVYELCETLRAEGRITFLDGIARSIRLVTG
jgi:DNA-binding IclR family transcriptional regulator